MPRRTPIMAAPPVPDPEPEPKGIECPRCGCRHFPVLHTDKLADGRIRRRRACRHCDHRLVTYEGTIPTLRRTLTPGGRS